MTDKRLLGKSDKLDFPDWNLKKVAVKIDTGAYRCSIDYSMCKVVKKGKEKVLQFSLLNGAPNQLFETTHFLTSKVKSSNGQTEKRYVVQGSIKIFDKIYQTEFTLSNRDDMKFPVLIGRKLLNNNFIVDTAKSNLSARYNKLKKKNITF